MDKQTALQALGLDEQASKEYIRAALKAKKQDIAEKTANAPTEALKAKFESLEAKLAEAEKALVRKGESKHSRSDLFSGYDHVRFGLNSFDEDACGSLSHSIGRYMEQKESIELLCQSGLRSGHIDCRSLE